MPDKTAEQSVSENEMDLWHRVIGRRRAEWSSLPRTELFAIVGKMEASPPEMEDPWGRTECILTRHFKIAVDKEISPKKRRSSWHLLNVLLRELDVALTRRTPRQESSINKTQDSNKNDGGTRVTTPQTTQPSRLPPAPVQSSVPPHIEATNQPVSDLPLSTAGSETLAFQSAALVSQNSAVVAKNANATTEGKRQEKEPHEKLAPKAQKQPQKQPSSQQEETVSPHQSQPVALTAAKSITADAVPARATPTPPSISVIQQPAAGNKQSVGSMGSAFSSTAKIAPASTNNAKVAPNKVVPPSVPVSILFGPDIGRYAAAIDKNGRSSLRATFQQRVISEEESRKTLERFKRWEPYWKIEHVVDMVETFPITRLEHLNTGTKPQQATECTINLDCKHAAFVEWGKEHEKGKRYAFREHRLLVRMLPVSLVQKKRPRADTHLWPKGTFVQFAGRPVPIAQRRQQQHDPTQWKSMSYPLDLTSKIAHSYGVHKLQLYFLDNEPYIVCVALCSYMPPDILNRVVWQDNWVKKLSMDEAMAKALKNAKQQTVVLDDTDTSNEMSSFIFPLSCPVSQQLLKTPVRGKTCSHWQCFDLANFVESNSHVTGTRWECPVCRNILSLRDLEHCPLTASILKEFETEATPNRERVQFFANGTWKLLDETKKRYSKKRSADDKSVDVNKRARADGSDPRHESSPEVIDLLL